MKYDSIESNILSLLSDRGEITRTELLPLLRWRANAKQMHATLDKMIDMGTIGAGTKEVSITRVRKVPTIQLSPQSKRVSTRAHEAITTDAMLT